MTIDQVAVHMTARIIGIEGMGEHQSEMIEMVTEINIIIEERNGLTDRAHETGNDAESGAGLERKMETDGKMDIERGAAKGAEMVGVSRMMADAMTGIDATASGLEAEKSIAHAEMIRRIDAWSALEAAHGHRTVTATPQSGGARLLALHPLNLPSRNLPPAIPIRSRLRLPAHALKKASHPQRNHPRLPQIRTGQRNRQPALPFPHPKRLAANH